jgi:hypothetical protein
MSSKNWGFLILGAVFVSFFITLNMFSMHLVCEKEQELWCAQKTLRLFKELTPFTIAGFILAIYAIKHKEK